MTTDDWNDQWKGDPRGASPTVDTLSDEKLAEIARGCEGVTPGPWNIVQARDMTGDVGIKADGLLNVMAEVFAARNRHDEQSPATLPTALHIARLDPSTVLSLVTELQSSRATIDNLVNSSGVMMVRAEHAEDALEAAQRAIDGLRAERVKPLEWGEDHPYPDAPWSKNYLHQRIARHSLGQYAGSYSVFECPDGKWAWASTWDDVPRELVGTEPNEAKAMAAAQADYAQRILSTLTPLPAEASLTTARADGIEEAAKWHDQQVVKIDATIASLIADGGWTDSAQQREMEWHRRSATALRALSRQLPAPTGEVEPVAWRPMTVEPVVKKGSEGYFIIAIHRAVIDKIVTFPAKYLNAFPLEYHDGCGGERDKSCPDDGSHEGGCPTTGWFYESSEGEYDSNYSKVHLEPGDKMVGWTDIPQYHAAPVVASAKAGETLASIVERLIADNMAGGTDDFPTLNMTSFLGDLTEAISQSPMGEGTVGVKPLEWRGLGGLWLSDGLIEYRLSQPSLANVWRWATNPNGPFSISYLTLDEAKAAAQADYETRILSALSPSRQGTGK